MKFVKLIIPIVLLFVVGLAFSGCFSRASEWTRSDMPLDGMAQVVTYNLRGLAGTNREMNYAKLRGVNEGAPTLGQEVVFDRMSGSKTQDVQVTLPDGRVYTALGMVKTERFAGLTHYMSLESATVAATDFTGSHVCGSKIRLMFNRNFIQYADTEKRDWDSIWYYDVPCAPDAVGQLMLDFTNATLRSVSINSVWQWRIAAESSFFNWGPSVTVVGGPAANLRGGWWMRWEGAQDAYKILNDSVLALESSPQPWVEFGPGEQFASTCVIYSAADADRYATFNRFFLNRQNEYGVLYRPDCKSQWEAIVIQPVYNYQWNDIGQRIAEIRGLDPSNPLDGKLDEYGAPKDPNDAVIKEFQRSGWINAPNVTLEQILFVDPATNEVLYMMTVRAFIGAADTLVMFGNAMPDLQSLAATAPNGEPLPMPVLYDEYGKPLRKNEQPYTSEQWADFQREATLWNYLKQGGIKNDLSVQYRFADNTSYAPITCRDSDGDSYTCGYRPVEWDLSTSYYFSDGDVRKPWLVMQLLGEVGVRTLGMSYVSGLYQGTGMLFAMGQIIHRDEFLTGYQPESIWTFDARASQTPDRLAEAWALLHHRAE